MLPSHLPPSSTDNEDKVPTLSQRFTFRTGGNGVRDALAEINQFLSSKGCLPADLRGNCEVVLAEVLNNIAEHSYKGCQNREFSVEVTFNNKSIIVETHDTGAPMPGLKLPEKKLPSQEVARDALPEGGFGWYLIHVLAPNPTYLRHGNTNLLRFIVTSTAGTITN